MTILRTQGNKYQEQADILDRKYSIAKSELRFLIGRAEPTAAQDPEKQAPVNFLLCPKQIA